MCANLVPIGCHAIIHTKHVTAQDASLGACPGELEILTVNFLANTPHEKERWLTKLGTLIAARGPAARGAQSGAAAGLGEVTGVRAPDEEDHAPARQYGCRCTSREDRRCSYPNHPTTCASTASR